MSIQESPMNCSETIIPVVWSEVTTKYLQLTNFSKIKEPIWDESKKDLHFVIILTDRIGDAFNSIYFLANLQTLYPNAKITYITKYFGDPQFAKKIISQYTNTIMFYEMLREEDFLDLVPDVIFDLNPVSELFKYYPSNYAQRVGHHDRCDMQIKQPLYNMKANDHLNILRVFGKDVKFNYKPLEIDEPNFESPPFSEVPNKPYFALCLEATARSWMLSNDVMNSLVNYLLESYNLDIVILGSDINNHGFFYNGSSERVHQCTGVLSLYQTVQVINKAKYVVNVDTGLMHAASYVGKPILGIFTCGDPIKNGPQGQLAASMLLVCHTSPAPEIMKRDFLQTFAEQDFINIDHLAEGLDEFFEIEQRPIEDYFTSKVTLDEQETNKHVKYL